MNIIRERYFLILDWNRHILCKGASNGYVKLFIRILLGLLNNDSKMLNNTLRIKGLCFIPL